MTQDGVPPCVARLAGALTALLLAGAAPATGLAARAPLTLDTHVDIPDAYMREPRFDVGNKTLLLADLDKLERGGLDAVFFVVFVEQGALTAEGYAKAVAQAERKYSAIELMLERYPDRIASATTPAQVLANHRAGKLSAMIGIENAYSLGHDLARMDAAYARGARYLGLVHVGNNDLCTSSMPDTGHGEPAESLVGISDYGRAAVARASALGVMVDISHASDACVRDVLKISRAPILASHSSARSLTPHARNLPDELLREIGEQGGVVQAVAYREFLKVDPGRAAAEKTLQKMVASSVGDAEYDSEKHAQLPVLRQGMVDIQTRFPLATLDDYLDHIQHVAKVAGIDHVGIASDFDGGGGITGWMDASQTANVTAGLRRRGYSETEVEKIWSGNLLRVWRSVEQLARHPLADPPIAAPVAPAPNAELDAIVDAVMARYHLPGIAVGVIEDGRISYVRTAGERVVGSGEPITADTLFKIASNSKAMTASVLARLVDAGKLQWGDPVIKYLPQFRMHDPWVTRNMQVRDLLVHNSGLPEGGGDLMLWPEPNAFTRADILAGLGHIKPAYSFRSGYAYDNLLYIIAGEVAAAAGGASYEALVRREVFEPLGLARCRVGQFDRDVVGRIAQPHALKDGLNIVMGGDPVVVPAITSAAAGGIRCSLDDMLAWMGNWLQPDEKQLAWLSAAQRREMWLARTPMPISQRRRDWDGTHTLAYAFGFRLADVDGEWTVSHTGTLNGMYSAMVLLPDRKSGFVLMTNGNGDDARTVLTEVLTKRFTHPDEDRGVAWYADALSTPADAPTQTRASDVSARTPESPARLGPWLGVWSDPWFGSVSICQRRGTVRFSAAKSPLMHGTVMRVGERWLVDWDEDSVDAEAWLAFTGTGADARLTMAKVDPDADFSFDYQDLAFQRTQSCD